MHIRPRSPPRRPWLLARTILLTTSLMMFVGCTSRENEGTVIAQNGEWTVTAIGPLDRADVDNTFDVSRWGTHYVQGAYLHFDSDSFDEEYPVREWVGPNALRFDRVKLKKPLLHIVLRNESTSSIKWMRVGSFECFLVFDVPPGGSLTLPCAGWHGGYGYKAEGEFQDGRKIDRTPSVQRAEPAQQVIVTVKDSGAVVTIDDREIRRFAGVLQL